MAGLSSSRSLKLRVIAVLVFLAALGPHSVPLAATGAERVAVRAGLHPNFGRMVFDWTIKVTHSASVKGRTLTIRFDTPVDPALESVRRVLSPYVVSIKRSKDPRVVVAMLKGDFKVRSSLVGNHVVVDLLKKKKSARRSAKVSTANKSRPGTVRKLSPPTRLGPRAVIGNKQSEKAPARGEGARPGSGLLAVRTGHHKDYGRLVFGWPRKVACTTNSVNSRPRMLRAIP